MEVLKNIYLKWTNLKPLSFIFTTLFLNFILSIPIIFVFVFLDITEEEIGGIDLEKYSFWGFFFVAVVFAPPIETLTGQLLPIKLIQKFIGKKHNIIALVVSAIIFSLMHFGYSIWYSLITLPMGILLAQSYIIFQERKESSFWITTTVHSLRNLIAVFAIYYDNPSV